MIRLVTPSDKPALSALLESVELFEPEELAAVDDMLIEFFDGGSEQFWLTDTSPDGSLVSAAYCAPERMTNGTWNLLFIGVRPEHQGKGHGSAMVHYIEQKLTEQGAHLLLVETLADFERTRAFYKRCGYEEEAHIRDFYDIGADKVIYRKALKTQA